MHGRLHSKRWLQLYALECSVGCQVGGCCRTTGDLWTGSGLDVSVLTFSSCLLMLQLLHALG